MPDLDSISILTLWTAIAIYAGAFIVYAFDLARRSSTVKVEERMLVTAGADSVVTAPGQSPY
ncbi:MAG TPA: c-type cytochrome biogenesis protein CcsB, partial [Microbacterium sp.]|nr:c-type cytochrome biogenesis protein CcsB [Microbacterium sp.]